MEGGASFPCDSIEAPVPSGRGAWLDVPACVGPVSWVDWGKIALLPVMVGGPHLALWSAFQRSSSGFLISLSFFSCLYLL